MSMLAAPDTITGPLRADDLDRDTNPGNVYPQLHRVTLMPAGCDSQGRYQTRDFPDTVPTDYGTPGWLDSCAPEGGTARDPVESMHRYRQTASTVRWGLALALVLAVVGYGARVFWPIV